MIRQPIQVLVLPYFFDGNSFKYCLFKRKDLKVWQAIAGGVEASETIESAALREAKEEAGITNGKIMNLDTVCSIPSIAIKKDFLDKNILIIKEYSFGIETTTQDINISDEHVQYEWFVYNDAKEKLFWDSNKTALWELDYRLTHKNLK